MKTKTFDCVRMKRQGADHVREILKGKSVEEELAFWREQTESLRREQRAARGETKPD